MKLRLNPVTPDKIRSDCDKLNSLFNIFENMSDKDVKEINEKFYTACNRARSIAQEYGFDADGLESFYKLQMWLEMYENYADDLVLNLEKTND